MLTLPVEISGLDMTVVTPVSVPTQASAAEVSADFLTRDVACLHSCLEVKVSASDSVSALTTGGVPTDFARDTLGNVVFRQ